SGDVAGQSRERVVAVGGRIGVAVAPLVERDDPEAAGERGCLVIPGARVARDTVEEQNRRSIGGAPVGQMEALAVHRQGPIGERHVPRHPSRILQELDTIRSMVHVHRETAAHRSRRHLLVVLVLTGSFLVVEVLGAMWTGSLALAADAGHMLTDVAGVGLALFAIWIASRPPTPEKTFGYYRVEILATVVNALLRQAVNVLLEGTPAHLELARVEAAMLEVAGVLRVHDLHVWTLTSGREAMSAHVVVADPSDSERLLDELHAVLHARFGIDHTTIQLDRAPAVGA